MEATCARRNCQAVVAEHRLFFVDGYFCDAQAAVPLTVGTRLGRPLAVGIELQPDSDEGLTSADMQCGFCIGVTWQRKLQYL